MNEDATSQLSATKATHQKPLVELEDDLDFGDVQLSPRQANANQEIVCEGGCE